MGSSTSKAAGTASKSLSATAAAARKYPTRSPGASSQNMVTAKGEPSSSSPSTETLGPRVHPLASASQVRDQGKF